MLGLLVVVLFPGGVARSAKKHKLTNSQISDSALIMPDDDFYPLARYIKKFGDPRDPKNRKRGHVVGYSQGHKGVIVPGDDGIGPWKLRRSLRSETKRDEDESLGSDSDAEQGAVAQQKFQDIVKQETDAYSSVAAGMMHDLLVTTAFEQERNGGLASAKKVKKKFKKKSDVKGSKKPRGNFQIASESDDSNESLDGPAQARAKATSRGGSTQSRNKTPLLTMVQGGAGGSLSLVAHEQTTDGKHAAQKDDDGKVGRKAKDVREVAVEHARAFETAGEDSVYFSEMAPVVLRSLARHNIHA